MNTLWDLRKTIVPVFVGVVVFFMICGGFKAYQARNESRAAVLLDKNELSEVIRHYSGTRSALVASMKLGKQAVDSQKWDEALQWYESVIVKSKKLPLLKVAALQNEALVYLKKGDMDRAVGLLDQTIQEPKNINPDYSRLLLAHVREVRGEKDKAQELYKSLSEGTADGLVQREAKERLTWLEGQKK